MNTPFTRRAALSGALAAIPALAGAAIVATPSLALAANPDPIFAAIEWHREAWRIFDATCGLTDNVVADREGREVTPDDEAAYEAANDAEEAALANMCETPPQTVAGMRAAIEYFVKFDTGCMPDASGAFLATLLKSPVLATKAGRPEGQTKGRP